MEIEQLKLNNQLCFPIYAASRLITREYQPYLDKLGITYPQYLVLMVLWETDAITVNEISSKLILNTNTLTPLLKRMESMDIISRTRSDVDERKVVIRLTDRGKELKIEASTIPDALINVLQKGALSIDQLVELKSTLTILIDMLNSKSEVNEL